MDNPYVILGLFFITNLKELTSKDKMLAKSYQPDKFDDKKSLTSEKGEEIFKNISNTYKILIEPNNLLLYISVEKSWNYIIYQKNEKSLIDIRR